MCILLKPGTGMTCCYCSYFHAPIAHLNNNLQDITKHTYNTRAKDTERERTCVITQKARWLQARLQTVLLELGAHRTDCLVERVTLAKPGFLSTGGSPVAGNRP